MIAQIHLVEMIPEEKKNDHFIHFHVSNYMTYLNISITCNNLV